VSESASQSAESSTESTDGTDPDTESDTDSSTSDLPTAEEPDVVAWDAVEDLVIGPGDFQDVPEEVKAEIEAVARTRTHVTNSEGEEFYTGRY